MEVTIQQPQLEDFQSSLTPKSTQDSSTKTKRSCPRRILRSVRSKKRRTPNDFSVNFSNIKISETNRVLRSESKTKKDSNSLPYEEFSNEFIKLTSNSVSQDHSYSKASKNTVEKPPASSVSPLRVQIKGDDVTSNEDVNQDWIPEISRNIDQPGGLLPRNTKIEIIDFDDLELSNLSYEDRNSKPEDKDCIVIDSENVLHEVSNDADSEDKPSSQHTLSDPSSSSGEDRSFPETYITGISTPYCDSDKSSDFETLLAKCADDSDDLYSLNRINSCLEQTNWLLESSTSSENTFENSQVPLREASPSPVYLDLDQNRITESYSSPTISQQNNGHFPLVNQMTYSASAFFQKSDVSATPLIGTSKFWNQPQVNCNPIYGQIINDQHCREPSRLNMNNLNLQLDSWRNSWETFPASFSNYQTLKKSSAFSDIHSISSKASTYFSTSGGSVERIVPQDFPKPSPNFKRYPGLSISPRENEMSTILRPSLMHMNAAYGQQPECRIHLVDTPPSFTRTTQPETPPMVSKMNFKTLELPNSQFFPSESSHLGPLHLDLINKPKRTRRTRAQMELYRQEMARAGVHRNKRCRRATSPPLSNIECNIPMDHQETHDISYHPFTTKLSYQHEQMSENYFANGITGFEGPSKPIDWVHPIDHLSGIPAVLPEQFRKSLYGMN